MLRHSKPNWLGRQHLDIFIPEIKLAIEYMGEQHFIPISFFGGLESFKRRQYLDKRKKELCMENGIDLIEVSYYEHYDDQRIETLILSKIKTHLQ